MKIAFNISPLKTGHAARGIGMYTKYLKEALLRYYPENEYVFFENNNFIGRNLDIIHYPFFDPFFLSLPLWKKTKTIVTVHDLIPLLFPEHFPAGLRGALKWQIQKLSLFGCVGVITDSFSSKKDIVRLTGISEKKVHVVYLAAGEEFKKINVDKTTKERLKKQYHLPDKFILDKNKEEYLDLINEFFPVANLLERIKNARDMEGKRKEFVLFRVSFL